ncbi:gliding motility-associated C-terminal domain-containing protein [Flavobacteriales bacterium]|nr:gliding motility-associated C-terminal domain-containing protein [Flavobacteriales bacterium]
MMNIKSYLFLVISTLLISSNAFAQQVFINQDFENPATMNWTLNEVVPFLGTVASTSNTFVVNDVYQGGFVQFGPFFFIEIPNTADQGYQPNSNYLHTASFTGLNGIPPNFPPVENCHYADQFWAGVNQELICAVTPDYSTIGFEGVDVSYWWFSGASEFVDNGTEVYYSIDQGTNWILIEGPLSADTTWQQTNIDFGNTLDNLPNVRFAFVFNNELEDNILSPDVTNANKGFGIDDFRLIADCEFSLPEDYTVCSGEQTTIFPDTTWYQSFLWNDGSTSLTTSFIVNNDTTIAVTATNEYCVVEDTINIFVQTVRADLGLSVNNEINGIGIPCFGDCNGELQLEVINGTAENDGSYTVQWLDSLMNPINNNVSDEVLNNFTSTLSLICEGKYYVSVLDAICTIPEMDSIEIFSNIPIENVFEADSVSCYNGSDGVLTSIPSGGVAPYSFNWGAYGTNQTITSLPIGTYTVVVTDTVGCSSDFSFEVEQPNQLIVDAFISDEISCYGESDGILSANVYGGSGNYSFVWSHPNYPWVDDSQYNLQTLPNLPFSVSADDIEINPNYQTYSDPYVLVVTDENGCQSQSEVYLIEPPKLNLFLTQPTLPAYCNNNLLGFNTGWAQVSANGGTPNASDNYNFVWSSIGQTDENSLYSTIENMNAGTYDVTVVDSRLCADQLTVEIGLETTWESFTSTVPASCFGYNDGSVSISMEGGCGDPDNSCDFTYLWNGGASTGNVLPTVENLQQGNYSVTVTDEYGCQGVYSLTIDGPTRVDFQITDLVNQSCYSPTASSDDGSVVVEVVGGSSPYTVNWIDMNSMTSFNNTTPNNLTITGLTASNWNIQITDDNGCNGIFDLTSLYPNPFIINDGVEVTSTINTNDLFLTDTINCFGASNGIASVLNSNPNFDYTWHLENSTDALDVGNTTTFLPAGNIQVTASYLLGLCEATSAPVTIVQRDPYVLNNTSSTPSCHGLEDAEISVSVTGATPYLNNAQISDYNFSWFPLNLNGQGVVNIDGSLDIDISNLDGGTYYLEVVDRYGCDTVFTIEIEDPSLLATNILFSDLDCHSSNGAPTGSITVEGIGGTTPYQSFNITSTNSNSTGTFTGLTAGTYNVFATDANGCESQLSEVILSEPSPLTITATPVSVDCDGASTGEIVAVANGGTQQYDSYSITGPTNSNSSDGMFSNILAGNYNVTVFDDNNCQKSVAVTVGSPTPFSTPTITFADPSCFGFEDGSIDLTITGGTEPLVFDWSNGDNTEDIDLLPSGAYSVVITDKNGCQTTANQTLTDPTEIVAEWVINSPGAIGDHYILSQPAPFNIEFSDVSQFTDISLNQWWVNGMNMTSNFYEGFDVNSFQHTFNEVGDYDVVMEVFDPSGTCSDTISITVSVQGIIEFNAFSPNGDNINDLFHFENYGIRDLNAIIYNRWGDKVYEIDGISDSWNGVSLNGLEVPEGVYFYVLNAVGEDGTPYNEKGSVTLYR